MNKNTSLLRRFDLELPLTPRYTAEVRGGKLQDYVYEGTDVLVPAPMDEYAHDEAVNRTLAYAVNVARHPAQFLEDEWTSYENDISAKRLAGLSMIHTLDCKKAVYNIATRPRRYKIVAGVIAESAVVLCDISPANHELLAKEWSLQEPLTAADMRVAMISPTIIPRRQVSKG